MKKIVIAIVVAALLLAIGLLGTGQLEHEQAIKKAHPEWAQFYED